MKLPCLNTYIIWKGEFHHLLSFSREDIGAAPCCSAWTELLPAISTTDPLATGGGVKEAGTKVRDEGLDSSLGKSHLYLDPQAFLFLFLLHIFFPRPADGGTE